MVSIVIPVKNGGSDLERCLTAIDRQVLDDAVEVIVVDSGSSDGSLEIARRHGAIVHEIPASSFTHGGARNLGASHARGEFLVFISQDAYAVESDWLERLTAPLREDARVAGVYGRQLPHEGATPPEVFFLDFLYGPTPRRQRVSGVETLSMDATLFSNVNAAIRKELWERFPFSDDIVMSEDQEWSRSALLAGYELVYSPEAAVRHSHNYTIVAALRRFFDSGVSSERAYMADNAESGSVLRSRAVAYAVGEVRWLWSTGQKAWIPYAAVYESAKMAGLILGIKHRLLPLALKRRLSALPSSWDNLTGVEDQKPVRGAEYTRALMQREALWKRIFDVQAPYRWNIRRLLGDRAVLDLGCGVGRNLAHLGPGSVGVDHNEHSVGVCRQQGLVAFTNEEFGATEYAQAGRYGGMLVAHVIEHLMRDEAVALLAGYLDYLAPGARVVLICPQERGFGPMENGFAPRQDGMESGQMAHVQFADFDALTDICTRLGLTVSKRISFPFPRRMGKVFPYNEFVVVATKSGAPAVNRLS